MFFTTIILGIAAGVFYTARGSSSGWAMQVCQYGDLFCLHPSWLAIATLLSLIWACFLRVDRL